MFLVSLVYATLLCKPATQMETAAGTLAKFQPLAIGWISAAKMLSVKLATGLKNVVSNLIEKFLFLWVSLI